MTWTKALKNSLMVGFAVVFASPPFLSGCDSETKKENSQLKERVVELQHQIDSMNSVLSMLEQAEDYYYKMAVNARQKGNFEISNKYLKEMIERFPESKLISTARNLIIKNKGDEVQALFAKALTYQENNQYELSNELLNKIIKEFSGVGLNSKAKLMLEQNQKAIKKNEEEESKKYSDLELITWSWSTSEGGSHVEARGQVKNISGQALRNVEAIVSFYDKKGEFITSGSALIDFNPILVGQTSPFSVLETFNPEMHSANIQFKFLSGETISTYSKSRK